MATVFQKTFGGLSVNYYVRQFCFALIFTGFFMYKAPQKFWLLCLISQFLYPYSRFVYESIIEFIMGDNVWVLSGVLFWISLFVKFIMMYLCYGFAIIIAPLGLIYLYFYHSRQEKMAE